MIGRGDALLFTCSSVHFLFRKTVPSETREKRVSDWLQENPHEDGDSQLRVEYVLFIQLIFLTFLLSLFGC